MVDTEGLGVLGVVDLDQDDAVAIAVVVYVLQSVEDANGFEVLVVIC